MSSLNSNNVCMHTIEAEHDFADYGLNELIVYLNCVTVLVEHSICNDS